MQTTPLIKICGLTTLEDTLAAIEFGADWLGFNFYPESSRFLDPDEAFHLFQEVPPNIPKVGVFVNEEHETVVDLAYEFDLAFLQFHGDESPEFCNEFGRPWIKAFRPSDESHLKIIPQFETDFILIDAYSDQYGGSGQKADWSLVQKAKEFGKKIILAGGLTAENIQRAITLTQPFAVDVASGVEKSPGVKDPEKMEKFIQRAKSLPLRLINSGENS